MTVEEVLIKLGVDSSRLDEGLRNAHVRVQDTMDKTHKSFLHGTSGARGFKKALHEVMQEAGPLGYALNAAISPIGGAFAAAAAGLAFFNKKLDEYNERLTKIREETIKPITNTGLVNAAKRAAKDFLADDAEQFANRRIAAVGPDHGELGEDLPTLRQRRTVLLGSIKADRNKLGPDAAGKLERDKALLAHFQQKVSEAEAKKAGLQEQASDPYHGMDKAGIVGSEFWINLMTHFGIKQPGMTVLKGMARRMTSAEADLKLLEEHKRKVESLTVSIHGQERAQTKSKESLKENEDAVIKLDKAIGKLETSIKATPAQSLMDQKTGGSAYRPLPGAPGYRDPITGEAFTPGIKYRPIRGAPGYVDPSVVSSKHTTEVNADVLLRLVYDRILGDGIPVVGKD